MPPVWLKTKFGSGRKCPVLQLICRKIFVEMRPALLLGLRTNTVHPCKFVDLNIFDLRFAGVPLFGNVITLARQHSPLVKARGARPRGRVSPRRDLPVSERPVHLTLAPICETLRAPMRCAKLIMSGFV